MSNSSGKQPKHDIESNYNTADLKIEEYNSSRALNNT